MRFPRCLVAVFLVLLTAPAWAAPKQKSSKPVAQHPPARQATHPSGNPHMKKNAHTVAPPGAHKHHKWL
jgi:hypothetical protein